MAEAEDLKAKFSKVLESNGILDSISRVILTRPTELKGEHTASVVETVRIVFENGKEPMELFVKKRLPPLPDPQAEAQMTQVMLNEGIFLTKFMREMKSFCEERLDGNGAFITGMFPLTYFADENVIIMENLSKQGYLVLPKKEKQDFNHAKLVVESLAKFHAVSHIMIENAGGKEKFLKSHPNFEETFITLENFGMITQSFEPSYEMSIEVIKRSNHEEKDEKYEFLQSFRGKLAQTFYDCLQADNLLTTVCHGDCWNNNMMFSNDHENVVFIDFQLSRLGSPSLDLAHFIFLSGQSEVRERWSELLQLYFNALKANVELLGHPFEFTYEAFLEDFGRKSTMSFIFGIFLVIGFDAIQSLEVSDPQDFSQQFNVLLSKWIDDNPDKIESSSAAMISLVNYYLKFGK